MRFSILKIDNKAHAPQKINTIELDNTLHHIKDIKNYDFNIFDIAWEDDSGSNNIKGIYFVYENETIILVDTFLKSLRDLSIQLFSKYLNSEVEEYHFSFDLKKLLESFDNITELRLRTSDPLIEEINVVGEDLENSESFDFFEDSEIVFFTTFEKNISASMKIFEDGRISIIPEKDYKTVVDFLIEVLRKV